MKYLKIKMVIISWIISVSLSSHADFLIDIKTLGDSLISSECDLKSSSRSNESIEVLWNQVGEAKTSYFGACRLAQDLYYIVRNSNRSLQEKAWVKLIETLQVAGDHVEVLNQSNIFLRDHPRSGYSHKVRWIILKVIYEQMNQSQGRDPSWAERIAGVHPSSSKAFYRNFIALKFIKDFPSSKMKTQAIKMDRDAKSFLSLHDLEIGKSYYSQKKFKAAIVRLSKVYQRGAQAKGYSEAVDYLILAFKEYKEQIIDAAEGKSGGFFSRGPSPQELASQLGYTNFSQIPVEKVVAELDAQIEHLERE